MNWHKHSCPPNTSGPFITATSVAGSFSYNVLEFYKKGEVVILGSQTDEGKQLRLTREIYKTGFYEIKGCHVYLVDVNFWAEIKPPK